METLFLQGIQPSWYIWLIPLLIWEAIWKGIGLWKSGRNNHLAWFVFIFLVNTIGILPIIYLAFFQKKKSQTRSARKSRKAKRRR